MALNIHTSMRQNHPHGRQAGTRAINDWLEVRPLAHIASVAKNLTGRCANGIIGAATGAELAVISGRLTTVCLDNEKSRRIISDSVVQQSTSGDRRTDTLKHVWPTAVAQLNGNNCVRMRDKQLSGQNPASQQRRREGSID